MSGADEVAARVAGIRERIARAAERAGRSPDAITLVAVCKRQRVERILAAYACGVRDFGENTAQGLAATAPLLAAEGCAVRWHFVGTLQRNKVKAVLPVRPVIHSIDRIELAEAISKRVRDEVEVLVQVNVGREPQKGGVEPEAAVELACAVAELPRLRLRGLMTLPPVVPDPRRFFDELRDLSATLVATARGREARELSMGMSDDFETAIACGATLVRVGTALFGPRVAKKE